ncbi:MAG TPA: CD225/dispanin family protein [Pilimelia sp.]|nr:CD225/dispanin family protein [Pilimelia sp.]
MQPNHPHQPPQIDNNMTMSIVSIFLFWPLAIPAIINASKVNPLLQQGNYAAAQEAAAQSKKWSKLAIIIGLVILGLNLVCCLILAVTGGFAALTDTSGSY